MDLISRSYTDNRLDPEATTALSNRGAMVSNRGAMVSYRGAMVICAVFSVFSLACGESDAGNTNPGASTNATQDGGGGGLTDVFGGGTDEDTTGPTFSFDTTVKKDSVEPGTFSAPCKENSECDSSLCISTADGKVCTKTCVESCPDGFTCGENKVTGGDTVFMCLPLWMRLCDPCTTNTDCNEEGKSGNVCVGFGKPGSFCGAKCELDKDCPGGYSCDSVTDATTGHSSSQCVVTAGLCACSDRAIELGLKTECLNTFQGSTCKGTRTCAPGGLTDCNAEVPKIEECNGLDDDCDGQTDNFEQGGGKCKGKANEFGQCIGQILSCKDAKVECGAPEAKPETCNGLDDNCDGTTDEGLCEDGDPCTQDKCNTDGSCKHVKLAGMACDDGNVCSQSDKCSAGKCVGADLLDCDDQDACSTDSCDPATGCKHAPNSAKNCKDDGNVCTSDTCEAGSCVHPPVKEGSPCPDDGEQCTVDQCKNKQCLHQPLDGKKCTDDGVECTSDVCENGKCIHPVANGLACEDGNPCTVKDKCESGQCKSGLLKKCDDNNPCTKNACDPKQGCIKADNNYAPCSAPSGDCPTGICWGGSCQSKPNETCNTEVKVSLCDKQPVIGVCSASGKCTPKSSPKAVSCSKPCNGICFNCFGIEVCFPIAGI